MQLITKYLAIGLLMSGCLAPSFLSAETELFNGVKEKKWDDVLSLLENNVATSNITIEDLIDAKDRSIISQAVRYCGESAKEQEVFNKIVETCFYVDPKLINHKNPFTPSSTRTALMEAVEDVDPKKVETLLKFGANQAIYCCKDHLYTDPFYAAVVKPVQNDTEPTEVPNALKIVELLLSYGADKKSYKKSLELFIKDSQDLTKLFSEESLEKFEEISKENKRKFEALEVKRGNFKTLKSRQYIGMHKSMYRKRANSVLSKEDFENLQKKMIAKVIVKGMPVQLVNTMILTGMIKDQ